MASTSTNRRQGINTGAAVKVACKAATTANITLSGEQTIDGIACTSGDRVFVKEQDTASENGIYEVSTSTWQRAKDFDGTFDVVEGTLIPVSRGTTNEGQVFRVTNTGTITIGTTSLTFDYALEASSMSYTPTTGALAGIATTVKAFLDKLGDAGTALGAALIGFVQSGSGTSRSAQAKLQAVQISPEDYGAAGDGATNDATAFTSAVARLVALGGGTLKGEPGSDYLVTSAIAIGANENILVDMTGCTVRTSAGDHYTFTVGGTTSFATALTYYDLTGTYEPGDMSVDLNSAGDASNFAVGDYVYIRASQDAAALTDQPIAEINKIKSISSATITFEWPLTKDYAAYSTYDFGIAVANSIIAENVHFKGGKYINHGRRPIQADHVLNFSIKDAEWEGRGGLVTRGRFIEVCGNTIKITPDWDATLYRPYFWAVDTGTSDASFHHNKCVSQGTGIIHIHEGQGNCSVHDNELLLGATDSAHTEDWPVISIRGRSWNTRVKDNTIINSPTDAAIEAAGSSIETGKGHYNLTISGNKIFGTVAGRGIDCDDTCTNLILSDNNVRGYTTHSIRVQGTGATITGNQVPSGTASIADGNEVYGNVGFVQEKVFLGHPDLHTFTGSPAISTISGGRGLAWLFDASTDEGVQTNLRVPKQATNVAFEVWWTNAGAGSGNVQWNVIPGPFADTESMNAADGTTLNATVAAPSQDVLKKSAIGSTFSVTGEDMLRVRIIRDADNVLDTLANDLGLVGVLAKFT